MAQANQRNRKSTGQGRKPTGPTDAATWKAHAQGVELQVPSGNVCLAKPVGMQVFLQRGLIPNSLMPIVKKAISTGNAPELNTDELTEEQIEQMFQLFDAVVLFCVTEPELHATPTDDDGRPLPPHERDEDKLYVDEVEMDDKMFIFQWAVGGTKDVESFRAEQATAMERLRSGAGVAGSPGGSA